MKKIKNIGKKVWMVIIAFLFGLLLVKSVYGATTTTLLGTDGLDDICCFGEGEVENLDEMITQDFINLFQWCTLRPSPDCIDITTVYIHNDGTNITIEINVQGDPTSCFIMIGMTINCTGDGIGGGLSNFFGMYGTFGEYSTNSYVGQNNKSGEGIANSFDFSNGDVRLEFPADWVGEGNDCEFAIVLFAYNPFLGQMCGDLFLAGGQYEDGTGGTDGTDGTGSGTCPTCSGSQIAIDPVTNIIESFANILFGTFLCYPFPFIVFVMILLVTQKMLSDRENKILDYVSLPVGILTIWWTTSYMLGVNIAGDFFGLDIINMMTLIVLAFFLVYAILSTLHAFDLMGNNSWAFTLGFTVQFSIGLWYFTPLFWNYCGDAVVSFVWQIIITLSLYIVLKISQKYSSKRGGGKTG